VSRDPRSGAVVNAQFCAQSELRLQQICSSTRNGLPLQYFGVAINTIQHPQISGGMVVVAVRFLYGSAELGDGLVLETAGPKT